MEEMLNQSENNVEVAEPQQLETQEPSANPSEVADPKPVQDAETNAHYAEMRRKQELDDYRAKVDAYEQQVKSVDAEISRMYGDRGIHTWDDYQRALREQEQREYYESRGVDPEVVEELLNKRIEQHPDIQYARQMKQQAEEQQRFQQEANELFTEFPDLKPEQIPAEVWQLKEQKGLSLLDSYLRVNFKSLSQQKEQEAIQKLQQNALSTPGSLGAGAEHKAGYANMSASEKKALREKVLRGELTSF